VDSLLFIALPYVALVVFMIGTIYRYQHGFKYSSLSSQLLETESLFPASVAFHVGIITIFLAHLLGFIFPSYFSTIGGKALIFLEIVGLIFGFLSIIGLSMLIYRRFTNPRVRVVTNIMDAVIEVLLLVQFIIGVAIAISLKWGLAWFASDMAPYLYSIFTFNPDISAITASHWLVQTHIVIGFLIILLVPFTRLVHFLVAPFHYITRPYQIVRWNWNPKTVRSAERGFLDIKKPKNN
jgi:nitrate reductase gamma subunit